MEVHKHPHHVMHKKKWSEYFLEFFMLFLAVFLGFVAENIREHAVEHEREKQYARQMLADLRVDSIFFGKTILRMDEALKKHQKFYELMIASVKPSNKELLNACLPLVYTFDVQVTAGTYNQMKTSGGLRYIKSEDLTNALQKYYEVLAPRAIKVSDEFEINYYNNTIVPYQLKYFRVQDLDVIGDSVKTKDPVILNRTNQADQELLNIMESYADLHRVVLERVVLPAKKQVNELIDKLKKDYDLE